MKIKAFLIFALMALFVIGCGSKTVVIKSWPPANESKNEVVIAKSLKKSELHLAKAKTFYFKGNYRQAMIHLEKAIQFDRENWEAHYYMALSMQKKREYAASIEALKLCLKLGPPTIQIKSEVHLNMALGFEKMDMIDRARAEYTQALALNSGNQLAREGLMRLKTKKVHTETKKKNPRS